MNDFLQGIILVGSIPGLSKPRANRMLQPLQFSSGSGRRSVGNIDIQVHQAQMSQDRKLNRAAFGKAGYQRTDFMINDGFRDTNKMQMGFHPGKTWEGLAQ